jgi:hypothetical protein
MSPKPAKTAKPAANIAAFSKPTRSIPDRTRAIPKSVVARAIEGVRYAITGVAPDSWFGPLQPLVPMAPAEVAGRRFDYPVGYNLQYGPRAYEPVSFADLRALADHCDILRLVIETRKDQIEAQDWDIRPKKQPDGARPRAKTFAREIAAAKSFLAFPDREHDFAQWTRLIAEDMFVVDAASLYKRRDRAGRVCAFEVIDGTTIAPRIDAWGRTPAPPDVAYQQILHGVPAVDYARAGLDAGPAQMTTDELLYYPRNRRPGHVYGQSPVEQIILTANIVTRRALHQLAWYTDGNLTDAVFTAPTGWTSEQIAAWQGFWDSLFAGNSRARRHGTWVPDGTKYVPLKDAVLKDAFDEYLARLICFCFSISPQPFVSQVNRATAETAKEQATAEGLAPVLNWFKRLIDIILQRHLGYETLEFVWIDDREMDPSAADAIDVADVKAGIRTVNEVRMARGLDPLPGGDKLMGVGAPAGEASAAPPHLSRMLGRPSDALRKFNPNHWPAGAPGSQGGRFAPKGGGGAGDGSAHRPAAHPAPTGTDASLPPSHNALQVHQAVLAALRLLSPGRDPGKAVRPYTDDFAKVTNRDAIDTSAWHPAFTIHGADVRAIESPALPGYPEYALKMYEDPRSGDTIAVTYVTGGASHDAFAIPYVLGKPVNAAIAGFFLMAVNESHWPKR